MWRLIKHRWLAAKRRTEEELERAIEHVFEHFGRQFKMKFLVGKLLLKNLKRGQLPFLGSTHIDF